MPYVTKTSCLASILIFHLVIVYKKIIDCFHDLTCLPNICGAIHGIHIPLASLPNKKNVTCG